MSFAHKLLDQWSSAGRTIEAVNEYSGDAQTSLEIAVPDSASDQQADLTLDVSTIKAIYILSDQDVTLETNDGTTPDDTISLKAGVPLIYHENGYFANPFSQDITALYLTNSSGAAATVQLEVVYDSTP